MIDPTNSAQLEIAILSIRARNEGAEMELAVEIGNGCEKETRKLTILTEQYCSLKPKKGPITEEQFETLETAARLRGALRSGQSALSYGATSVMQLARKIRRKGYSKEEADCAADRLRDAGLIDEQSNLEQETEKCLRKLWGAGRIRAHLWSKGFAEATLACLPALLKDIDFTDRCAQLIRKRCGRLPADANERKKLYAALARYGYSPQEIREAFRQLNN